MWLEILNMICSILYIYLMYFLMVIVIHVNIITNYVIHSLILWNSIKLQNKITFMVPQNELAFMTNLNCFKSLKF